MGVLEADNAWWLDVLEHGRASTPRRDLRHRMAAGAARDGRPACCCRCWATTTARCWKPARSSCTSTPRPASSRLRYWDHRFPIDPRSYPAHPGRAAARRRRATTARATATRWSRALLDALRPAAVARRRRTRARGAARVRDAAVYKRQLARLARAATTGWRAGSRPACSACNGQPGEPASFDALDAADRRARPTGWPTGAWPATTSTTAASSTSTPWPALRMERPEVFEATHRKVLRLAAGRHARRAAHRPSGRPERPAGVLRAAAGPLRGAGRGRRRTRRGRCTWWWKRSWPSTRRLPRGLAGARRHRLPLRQPGQRPVRRRPQRERACWRAYHAFTGEPTDFDEVAATSARS